MITEQHWQALAWYKEPKENHEALTEPVKTVQDRILELLESGPLSTIDMAAILGKTPSHLSSPLSKMVLRDLVYVAYKVKNGKKFHAVYDLVKNIKK